MAGHPTQDRYVQSEGLPGRQASVTDAPSSDPGTPETTNRHLWGIVAGAVAVFAAWFFLPGFTRMPFGGLLLNAMLAWGFVSTLTELRARGLELRGLVLVVAATGLAAALISARLLPRLIDVPLWLTHTWAWPALVIVGSLSVILVMNRWRAEVGVRLATALHGMATASVVVWYLYKTDPPGGSLVILLLALGAVAAALVVQQQVAIRVTIPRFRFLGEPAALAATGSQLVDGWITYLAVNNPFGLAPQGLTEQVALSAWVLENGGALYPLIKWFLGAAIYLAIRPSGLWSPRRSSFFVLLLLMGLGPGIYSGSNVI